MRKGQIVYENRGSFEMPESTLRSFGIEVIKKPGEHTRYESEFFDVSVVGSQAKVTFKRPLEIEVSPEDALLGLFRRETGAANCVNATNAFLKNIQTSDGIIKALTDPSALALPKSRGDQLKHELDFSGLEYNAGGKPQRVHDTSQLSSGVYQCLTTEPVSRGNAVEFHTFLLVVPAKGSPYIVDPATGQRRHHSIWNYEATQLRKLSDGKPMSADLLNP